MAIDYSKWDKIELSDDSDIEVHPNVDKNSFIRWKQRDIHEKRHQRNIEIKSILVQLTMYAKLNKRVDFILQSCANSELLDDKAVMARVNSEFSALEKFNYDALKKEQGDSLRKGLRDLEFSKEEIENTPTYNEMIEDLFVQIKEDHPEAQLLGDALAGYIREHRAKIDDILLKQTVKLDDLLYQKLLLISSDDYHTGFDRSFMNKDDEAKPQPKPKETVTTVETINTPKDEFDELHVLPETAAFGDIDEKNLDESAAYLIKHPFIVSENQKDSLIMTAFDHQLKGDTARARQIVFQLLLLQYVAQLAGLSQKDQTIRAVKLFFSKIKDKSLPAHDAFQKDVENTVNHIRTRCEVLSQEREEEEAIIQLKAIDDSTELVVNVPAELTPEYETLHSKVPPEMVAAIMTRSIDEVNKVFAEMSFDAGEQLLQALNECNVIGVTDVVEKDEFQELKTQYEKQLGESASPED